MAQSSLDSAKGNRNCIPVPHAIAMIHEVTTSHNDLEPILPSRNKHAFADV